MDPGGGWPWWLEWKCPAYFQLVDEHGDGVELIIRVRRVSHGERDEDGVCDVIRTRILRFWDDGGA